MNEPPLTAVDTVYCVQGTRTNQYGRHVPCCDDGLHWYITSLKKQKHEYHGLACVNRAFRITLSEKIHRRFVQTTEKSEKCHFVL
jgi:hypothetical protein